MNKNFSIETRYNTLKMHKENYDKDLKIFLDSHSDNLEIDFLEIDLFSHKAMLEVYLTKSPDGLKMNEKEINQRRINSQRRIIEFTENRIAEIENELQVNENSLNWKGTPTEFIELSKALFINGSITGKGNQEDNINQLANLLNFKVNNPYKILNDIKSTRSNGSETLFLNKLKTTFFNYITLEKKK